MNTMKLCDRLFSILGIYNRKSNFKNYRYFPVQCLKYRNLIFRLPCDSINTLKESSIVCEEDCSRYKDYIWKMFFGLSLSSGIILLGLYTLFHDNEKYKDLFQAAKVRDIRTIRKLAAEGINVNRRHRFGWTALHLAAVNGNVETVQTLLDAGADPNLRDEFTNVEIMAKITHLDLAYVFKARENDFTDRPLLDKDCTYYGFTALHYAAIADEEETVKILLERGADPTIETETGTRPHSYATTDVRQLLLQHVAKFDDTRREKGALKTISYLEQKIRQHIIGQDYPIKIVTSSIRRKENGWSNDERPIVFLFLGSSGVGKTELAKQVGKYVRKVRSGSFIRIDMSEFQQKHDIQKLIGTPPGYSGYEYGGQLTKQLKNYPSAVVLFDEIDKAHPEILTVLLQLFDEGRITNGLGYTIDCRNAIFIMTSNLANDKIIACVNKLRNEKEGIMKKLSYEKTDILKNIYRSSEFRDDEVYPILKKYFKRDEFIGRINEIVYFIPFSHSEIKTLVTREIKMWAKKAKATHNIELIWDRDVELFLMGGYNIRFGVRSIKNEVERRVIKQLASAHDLGIIRNGSIVRLTVHWPTSELGSAYIKLLTKVNKNEEFVEIDEEMF